MINWGTEQPRKLTRTRILLKADLARLPEETATCCERQRQWRYRQRALHDHRCEDQAQAPLPVNLRLKLRER